jgi:hypothetical protein
MAGNRDVIDLEHVIWHAADGDNVLGEVVL